MGSVATAPGPVAKGVYVGTIFDTPGVAAANNFLCIFNPTSSANLQITLLVIISSYSVGASSTANSMLAQRVTSVSGGTLQAASTIGRFVTTMPDPQIQVFTGNPTVTTAGQPLAAFPPPISTGVGVSSTSGQTPVPGASFVVLQGQGIVFRTAAGNTNQVWNFEYAWEEI